VALVVNERKLRIKMAEAEIRTYKALAKKAGMTAQTLSELVHGDSFSSLTVDRLARALECSVLDILEDRPVTADLPHAGAPALTAT
jgi:DNA-binding Xre family transcriptional regulator